MAGAAELREYEADVVVVGAGLAGLAAARAVERAAGSAVVLEARDRVGGRLESVELDDGVWADVGGQWIGPTQDRIAALARELGAEIFPTYAQGENIVELGAKLVRYTGTIPRLGPHVLADIGQAMRKLDRMAKKVPLETPWEAPKAQIWDSQTVWSWTRRNLLTRGGREMLAIAVKAVWAAMPADVSLLHLLFYIHSAGKLDLLLDTEQGAQQNRFVAGAGTLAATFARTLPERIALSAPVRRVDWTPESVTVHADGALARGQRAIFALPPALAGRIVYDPPLPGYRDQLTQRVPMGAVIKCLVVYDEPFWRHDGLSGETVSTVGPFTMTFDNSPPSSSPGVLVGFLEGHWARELGRSSQDERRSAVLACLARLFGSRAARPEHYLDKCWADEPYSRGCYVGFTPPGVLTAFGPALREPIGPLHWAGTETATVWNGYMDGAIQSGERAAAEVLEGVSFARAPALDKIRRRASARLS